MQSLSKLFTEHEDWLMQRILRYARKCGYTKYTSTLQEAWRLSISGLTASLCEGMKNYKTIPELGPNEDFTDDPISEFAMIEAQRHRKRGITLAMFLGLMKYYRQSYLDLLTEKWKSKNEKGGLYVNRCFDRIEVAFCQEWANITAGTGLEELQNANRIMTNEKNAYLTVFESIFDPVVILDKDKKLVNMNHAASLLIDPDHVPGEHYHHAKARKDGSSSYGKRKLDMICIGRHVSDVYPWLAPTLESMRGKHADGSECETVINDRTMYFDVRRSDMLDVSEKFTATIIILRDITERKSAENEVKSTVAKLSQALSEVKSLSGLLPICANCKKVRDDKGYWRQVEEYISKHSEATFSHSICPECVKKLYPQLD